MCLRCSVSTFYWPCSGFWSEEFPTVSLQQSAQRNLHRGKKKINAKYYPLIAVQPLPRPRILFHILHRITLRTWTCRVTACQTSGRIRRVVEMVEKYTNKQRKLSSEYLRVRVIVLIPEMMQRVVNKSSGTLLQKNETRWAKTIHKRTYSPWKIVERFHLLTRYRKQLELVSCSCHRVSLSLSASSGAVKLFRNIKKHFSTQPFRLSK